MEVYMCIYIYKHPYGAAKDCTRARGGPTHNTIRSGTANITFDKYELIINCNYNNVMLAIHFPTLPQGPYGTRWPSATIAPASGSYTLLAPTCTRQSRPGQHTL